MTTKLNGYDAIEAKQENGDIVLCKYADPTEGPLEGITIEQAEEIADEDPSLIHCDVNCVRNINPKFGDPAEFYGPTVESAVAAYARVVDALYGEHGEYREGVDYEVID